MFGNKKGGNKKEEKSSQTPNSSQKNAQQLAGADFNTMSDDLDLLSGKIEMTSPEKVSSEKENSTKSPFLESPPTKPKENSSKLSFYANNLNRKKKDPPAPKPTESKTKAPLKKPILKEPEIDPDKKSGKSKVAGFLVATIILVAIVVAAYYFWMTRFSDSSTPVAEPEKSQPVKETPPLPEISYLTDMPNYLQIDTETITLSEASALLKDISKEVSKSSDGSSFEFLVTDKTNTPIAFSRFAHFFGVNLSQEILNSLDEKFSLYFLNDSGNIRLGLIIDLPDESLTKENLSDKMLTAEKNLVNNFDVLFLEATLNKNLKGTFNDGIHGNYAIRYINLDTTNSVSIDYAITDSYLAIGMSKKTIRFVLDKTDTLKQNTNSEDDTSDKEKSSSSAEELELLISE